MSVTALRHAAATSDSALDKRADALAAAQSDFLDQLIDLRDRHKLTQQDVADLMGISQSAVCKFEREDSNPTLGTLRRYALAVGARFRIEVVDDCVGQADPEWQDNWAVTRILESVEVASPPSHKRTFDATWEPSGAGATATLESSSTLLAHA